MKWPLRITTETRDGVHVLALAGRVGRDSAPTLAAAIATSLTRTNPLTVIDLEHVDYISSGGLHVILHAALRSANQSGMLVLASVCEPVRVALDLGGVLAHVAVAASRMEAVARAKAMKTVQSVRSRTACPERLQ